MGHVGAVQGWFAPSIQELLDGALAPLRNVHKFDPVIRLPLVLGLAFSWTTLWSGPGHAGTTRRAASEPGQLPARWWASCVLAVLGAALPAAAGPDHPGRRVRGRARLLGGGRGLARRGAGRPGTALLVPGLLLRHVRLGLAADEPFQSLAGKPWAIRNAVPLAPAGNIRMLDARGVAAVAGTRVDRRWPGSCAAPASATSSCATT